MRTYEDRQLFWAFLQNFETTIITLRKHHCHHCQSTPGWGLFLYCIKCANYPSCGEYERQQSPQLLSYPPTFLPLLCVTSNHLSHLLTVFLHIHRFIRTPASMMPFSEQKGEIGNKLLNKSIFPVSRHQIKSSALVVFLHIHRFIRISIMMLFLGDGASCPKSPNPISPFISYHLQSSVALARHILTYSILEGRGANGENCPKITRCPFPFLCGGSAVHIEPRPKVPTTTIEKRHNSINKVQTRGKILKDVKKN